MASALASGLLRALEQLKMIIQSELGLEIWVLRPPRNRKRVLSPATKSNQVRMSSNCREPQKNFEGGGGVAVSFRAKVESNGRPWASARRRIVILGFQEGKKNWGGEDAASPCELGFTVHNAGMSILNLLMLAPCATSKPCESPSHWSWGIHSTAVTPESPRVGSELHRATGSEILLP